MIFFFIQVRYIYVYNIQCTKYIQLERIYYPKTDGNIKYPTPQPKTVAKIISKRCNIPSKNPDIPRPFDSESCESDLRKWVDLRLFVCLLLCLYSRQGDLPSGETQIVSIFSSKGAKCWPGALPQVLQGPSWQTGFFELGLRDRNIQVRFCLKIVLKS